MSGSLIRGDMYFFDIPIYRCTLSKHTQEMITEKTNLLKTLNPSEFARNNQDLYADFGDYFDRHVWYSWRYNDIIGWIRLFVCGTQLRGDLWWVNTQRIVRRGKKDFRYSGKAFESQNLENETSDEIFETLCNCLKMLSKDRPIKGRYIDMELIMTLGPYVNWRKLMGLTKIDSPNKR